MTGLKSGSGDDLWDDDSSSQDTSETDETADAAAETESPPVTESRTTTESDSQADTTSVGESADEDDGQESVETTVDSNSAATPQSHTQSYIVRRAIQDKSVQFERDERLTFFVHDDVVDGERELVSDLEAKLGRDIPKFDVREAVYRAALQNPDDVLAELVEMGYSVDGN